MGWEFISKATTQEIEYIHLALLSLFAFQSRVRWGVCALSVIVGLCSASNLSQRQENEDFGGAVLKQVFVAFPINCGYVNSFCNGE